MLPQPRTQRSKPSASTAGMAAKPSSKIAPPAPANGLPSKRRRPATSAPINCSVSIGPAPLRRPRPSREGAPPATTARRWLEPEPIPRTRRLCYRHGHDRPPRIRPTRRRGRVLSASRTTMTSGSPPPPPVGLSWRSPPPPTPERSPASVNHLSARAANSAPAGPSPRHGKKRPSRRRHPADSHHHRLIAVRHRVRNHDIQLIQPSILRHPGI